MARLDGDMTPPNYEEFVYATYPCVQDTDEDGLDDGPEVNTWLTDPLNPDSDWDGLSDGDEVNLCLPTPWFRTPTATA